MTASIQRTSASGSTDTFTVAFGYLDQSHVKVYQDGALLTAGDDYTWPDAGNIQLTAGNPTAGSVIERRRVTPVGALVDFEPGNMYSSDLDYQALQALYLAEEARDIANDLEGRGWVTALLADGGTIEVGDGGELLAFDSSGNIVGAGYTTTQLEAAATTATTKAAEASASAATAAAAADSIGTSVTDAEDAAAAAEASASEAAGDAIATAADRVQTGLDAVATAADAASTAADAISTAADAASTAADAASTAVDAAATDANLTAFYDSFIGAATSDPENDLNGDPVSEGQFYWNTVSKTMRVYNGSEFEASYLPASGYAQIAGATFTGNIAAPQVTADGGLMTISGGTQARITGAASGGWSWWAGIPDWDPDGFYIYGPASASGAEVIAKYSQNIWAFSTGGTQRVTIDASGHLSAWSGSIYPAATALSSTFYFGALTGNPLMNFDSNDYLTYDKTSNFLTMVIAGANSWLQYQTYTDLRCGVSQNATGDDGTKSSGTYTPSPSGGNLRKIVNNGAFTLAAPGWGADFTMIVKITNGASAGAITLSGFTNGGGDDFTTTNGHIFFLHIRKIDGTVSYYVEACQ